MTSFLTDDELAELTGRTRAYAQVKWLRENCWPFSLNADGKPKLLREVMLSRMGLGRPEAKREPRLHL